MPRIQKISAGLSQACAARRARLAKKIRTGVVVVFAAEPSRQSNDVEYFPYQPDNYFYYLTGCDSAHAAYILTAHNGKIDQEWFFCRAENPLATTWDGPHLNTRTAQKQLGFSHKVTIDTQDKIAACVQQLATQYNTFFCLLGYQSRLDSLFAKLTQQNRTARRHAVAGINLMDLSVPLDEMRLVKDAYEIACMREACRISGGAIIAAMQRARTLQYEYQIEAVLAQHYRFHNAQHAFAPIVASGRNACYLHYTQNAARIGKDRLMLIDSGCRWRGYAGDITRTFPVSGQWTDAQKHVYNIVLAAQQRALSLVRSGCRWQAIDKAIVRVLANGLYELGLCRGSVNSIMQKETYRRFYMHGGGHWLGLDVHDVGSMLDTSKPNTPPRSALLKAGMVCTIEPGLYIPSDSDIPAELRGIGVRIEDDVLVTKNGCEVLTADVPKTPRAITQCIRQGAVSNA